MSLPPEVLEELTFLTVARCRKAALLSLQLIDDDNDQIAAMLFAVAADMLSCASVALENNRTTRKQATAFLLKQMIDELFQQQAKEERQ